VLVSVPDADPWCGSCEWNLDAYEPRFGAGWVWNKIYRWDQRAGFRADRLLGELSRLDPAAPIPPGPYRILVGVSIALMLGLLAALEGGIFLLVAHEGPAQVVGGVFLLWLAWMLRPRFGRLKKLLEPGYRIPENGAPTLRALIERVARETGAPLPEVLAFDFSWNAAAAVVGVRRTRVLLLGVPMLLALKPQELVALIGHELGHFQYGDNRRAVLTGPALTIFGNFSRTLRPRPGDAFDRGLYNLPALVYSLARLAAGLISVLLWGIHIGLHVLDSRYGRRVELRADTSAVRVAGSAATLDLVDLLAMIPELKGYVQHYVPKGEAAATWRRMLASVRERQGGLTPLVRQHSIRLGASLLASHPTPGRRHQWLTALPTGHPAIVLDPETTATIEREVAPYAEALHLTMLEYVTD